MPQLHDLEKKLQHTFSQKELLEEALTHPSTAAHRGAPDYERLEFLGDRVLGLVVAEWLFREFQDELEGVLARRHSNLVCRSTLAEIAKEVGLDQYIKLAHGERKTGGQEKISVLANCCEAVIAALYLDGGLKAAQNFIKTYWSSVITSSGNAYKDHKSLLQEWAQGRGFPAPHYQVIEQSGLQHQPLFTIEVSIGDRGQAQAQGRTKQEAAQKAAGNMLEKLKQSDHTYE